MSKKLLLADDSITIQKVIQITFAHEDYELTITDNGDAALAKAQEIKPDLVMADVYMPGKNGYELTTAIRQDPALQNIPVLLLAGSFEPFDEDKAKSCQANAWIEKPFESQSLIDKVAELLSAAPAAEAAAVAPEVPAVEPAAATFVEAPVAEPAAAPEDPFGDISFEEESASAPEVEPSPAVVADDDWADVSTEAPAEEVAFADEPVADFEDDFSFAEEAPVAEVEDIAEPVAEVDAFEMGEDEIMPLDDDDILGAEDLEPAPAEQTLATWSRDDTAEDVFSEPLTEAPLTEAPFAEEDVFAEEVPEAAAPVADELPSFADESSVEFDAPIESPAIEEPVVDEPDVFAEPAPSPFVEEVAEPVAPAETEPAAAAVALGDVEQKAASLSETELEEVIEKVVTKVVEKLAGTILERVAWEVVPDMAENLIKEEIRKIKDAAA